MEKLQQKNISASTSVWTEKTIATTEQVSKRLQERLICKYLKKKQKTHHRQHPLAALYSVAVTRQQA